MSKNGNNVDHPNHYNKGGIETIDFIVDKNMGFFVGNITKYISRHRYKNGIEDLKKALWYFNRLMKETIERHENKTIRNYIPVIAENKIDADNYAREQGLTKDESAVIYFLLRYQFDEADKFSLCLLQCQICLLRLFDKKSLSANDLTLKKMIEESEESKEELRKITEKIQRRRKRKG